MQYLKQHEILEMDVLENLSKGGFLRPLIFGGGTMLRLCHELPRYSVDLDFWFSRKQNTTVFYRKLLDLLESKYRMTDSMNKHYTLLYEVKSPLSERKLKIEIRKDIARTGTEEKIAFSPFSTSQVPVRAFSLEESAKRKLLAIRGRDEMRDYFDLEFILRRGAALDFSEENRRFILRRISRFKRSDYSAVLGSLLEKNLRDYYAKNGFAYLSEKISASRGMI